MLSKIRQTIDRFIWNIRPRVYNCRDIWLIKWRGREYYIRKRKY